MQNPADDADVLPPARVSAQAAAVTEAETRLVPDGQDPVVTAGRLAECAEAVTGTAPMSPCCQRRSLVKPRSIAGQVRAGPLIQVSQRACGEGCSLTLLPHQAGQ